MARTTTRKPPNIVGGGARPPAKPAVPDALKKAIESLGTKSLRKELKFLCQKFPAVIHTLEDRLLVQMKDVVRYHIDTDSEDHANSEGSESESSPAGEIGDERYTARMAKCENCSQEFDVTLNKRGDCLWHPGIDLLLPEGNQLLTIRQETRLSTSTRISGLTTTWTVTVHMTISRMTRTMRKVSCGIVVMSPEIMRDARRRSIKRSRILWFLLRLLPFRC
jgi:hypothetical protein